MNQGNIFMRLMAASREKKLPERYDKASASSNGKLKLSNAIIDWLEKNDLGVSSDCVDHLEKELVSVLTNAFWCIDGHYMTLRDRWHGVPGLFHCFQNFNIPEKHKHRKRATANLNHENLSNHSAVLFRIRGTSYTKGNTSSLNPWIPVRENLLRLADNEWEIYNSSTINLTWQSKYSDLHKAIREIMYLYFLNNFTSTDHRRKYDYLEHLPFPSKVVRFFHSASSFTSSPCLESRPCRQ